MRIGHYMTGLWHPGGIASYVRRISDGQRAAGRDVRFFDLERHRPADAGDDWPGTIYVADEAALFDHAARERLDVLHAHTLVERAAESPVPIIRTLHGHEPYCPSGGRFLATSGRACDRAYHPVRCAMAHVLDRCGSARPMNIVADLRRTRAERRATRAIHTIAITEYLRGEMLRNGYGADRVHTLLHPGPTAGEVVPLAGGVPRFVFLGRLTIHKGVDWLLKATATAKREFAIDIAGQGNAIDDLKALARSLKIESRVTFHGWLASSQAAELVARSRALVFPSLWPEPAGLVAFDAMAQGRAVIASRIGGIPEMVGETAALLVPPGDVAALAGAMDQLAVDATLAESLGAAGRERLKQFTLASHLDKLDELYRLAMADHGGVRAR